jgi:hypothetical protein
MERGYKKVEAAAEQQKQEEEGLSARILRMLTNIAFVLPLLINWTASIWNNVLLASNDMSIAVPAVNCITFMTTFITQRALQGRSPIDFNFFAGSLLIMLGMYLCLTQ